MIWSSPAPKWPISIPFCGMDHQKSNFSLISDTLSVGGCWGQPMSFFWKLVDAIQIFLSPEATRHHNSIKLLILLPLRADLLYILHYETPCICSIGRLEQLFFLSFGITATSFLKYISPFSMTLWIFFVILMKPVKILLLLGTNLDVSESVFALAFFMHLFNDSLNVKCHWIWQVISYVQLLVKKSKVPH